MLDALGFVVRLVTSPVVFVVVTLVTAGVLLATTLVAAVLAVFGVALGLLGSVGTGLAAAGEWIAG